MSFCRTMVLIAAGAVLAGCAATAPQRPGAAEPESPRAAGSATGEARGVEVEVEAEGIAYMGDKDRREDVEARAERKAIDHAARKAFGLHVQEIVETDVGTLIKDTKTQTVVGTFTSITRVDEAFDGSRYRVRIRAEGRRESGGAGAPRPSGGASPEEQTAKAETAPPAAASSGPAAGGASAAASRAGEGSDAVPASGGAPAAPAADQGEETAKTRAAPAKPVVSTRSRRAVTVCCHEFPRTLVKRVRDTRSMLAEAPGVIRVEEVRATDTELCYRIHHDGSLKSIDEWIDRLRTDAALPFKRRYDRGANVIDLVFDAGFD